MKIILTHEVSGLGRAGEVVEVKDGYGRNYLLPRGYATKWTAGAQRQIDQIAEARRRRAITSLEDAHELREALEAATLTITKTAGDNGRLFGAVSGADVAAAASELTGKEIDRRQVTLPTVKSLGDYKATIKLHDDVSALVAVSVVPEPKKKKRK
ncbi:MAG: 50S ribosomal protein L9 [Actinomycetaceae bacterium]|jgi:large subunit ribosomal protein L9|nr:50S ribosomal protein L9 [Actinomycetaceae bacterium]